MSSCDETDSLIAFQREERGWGWGKALDAYSKVLMVTDIQGMLLTTNQRANGLLQYQYGWLSR